jgi:peptidoglycan/LPS O-acetylase OafA/YrhL
LLLSATILGLQKFTNFQWYEISWDWFSPYFSFVDVILRFLLIHNFTAGREVLNINAPMWSVAVEWHIYAILPLQILESPIAIILGLFSYSLYLTHAPVLTLVRHFIFSLSLSSTMVAVLLYLVAVPICLLFAYLFYLAFERQFTTNSSGKQKLKA